MNDKDLDGLVDELKNARISRRQFMERALVMGLTASGVAAVLEALGGGGVSSTAMAAKHALADAMQDTAEASSATTAAVRGLAGDLWADVIVGQPDFGQITPNEVTPRRLFNPGGVLVDRSVRPNRLYVYDGGNSRVLGLDHLGHVQSGPAAGKPCTSDSDFGAPCVIEEGRGADLVLGQPGFTRSACNGDGNFQTYPDRGPASAATLCSMPVDQISPLEGGSFANMALDAAGDLYVPDFDNHRVLLYRSPFEEDTIADDVWGQADFSGNACNRGRGVGAPSADSLCLRSPFNEGFVGGAGVDPDGNLWVTDNQNNRTLRFPLDGATGRPAHGADLVLGQPDFTSWLPGSGLDRMHAPAAVRIDQSGVVYVADSLNRRILVFRPPLTSGMAASGTLGTGFRLPSGLEFDLAGGLWVSDRLNNQLLLLDATTGAVKKVLLKDVQDDSGTCGGSFGGDGPGFFYPGDNRTLPSTVLCDPAGSIGVDVDGNVFVTGSDNSQDAWRFPAPIPDPRAGTAHSADARLFVPFQSAVNNSHNEVGLKGIFSARGVAVARGQLIVADGGRLLFWNNPKKLRNGQRASGFVGSPSPRVQAFPPAFGRIREDGRGRLWVIRGSSVFVYRLPLVTGEEPQSTVFSPLPVLGGGALAWNRIDGIAPDTPGAFLWLSDTDNSRVFRVRDPIGDPVVDIVLGQTSIDGTGCNQGRGAGSPSRDSLCLPGAVALDRRGNLWVSDNSLEDQGNQRLLEYDAALFTGSAMQARFGLPASRVFGTGGSFAGPSCQNPLCGPFEPAFSRDGHMVVGLNAIRGSRFPLVYNDPLVGPLPDAMLKDFHSMAYAATFDMDDNLYVADLNRDRVFIYRKPFVAPH